MIGRECFATSGPYIVVCIFEGGGFSIHCQSMDKEVVPVPFEPLWLRGRSIGALRFERHTSTSANGTSRSVCHKLLCSHAFLLIVLRSAQHAQVSETDAETT